MFHFNRLPGPIAPLARTGVSSRIGGVQYTGGLYESQTSGFTAVTTDSGKLFSCSGTFTVDFSSASAVGNGWAVTIHNVGTGVITLDPNGAETINGITTLALLPGDVVFVYSDGSNLQALFMNGGGPNDWELVDYDNAISAASTADFTDGRIAGSRSLRVDFDLTISINNTFGLQVFTDGGTTPISADYDSQGTLMDAAGGFQDSGESSLFVLAGDNGAAADPTADNNFSGQIILANCDSTAADATADLVGQSWSAGNLEASGRGNIYHHRSANTTIRANDVDALRLLSSSGTLTGRAWVYKWRGIA